MQYRRWVGAVIGLAMVAVLIDSAASSAVATSPKDTAILRAGVIAATDVPPTWTAHQQPDPGTKQLNGIAACKQMRDAVVAANKSAPRAQSPTFADTSTSSALPSQATDVVYAFKSTAAAKAYLATDKAAAAPECLQQVFQKMFGQATVTSITDQLQGVGDDHVGFEVAVTGMQNGQPLTLTADNVVVRVGRVFVGFQFYAEGSQAPSEGPAIVNAVVGRVKAVPQ
jgi:hypothetical protein